MTMPSTQSPTGTQPDERDAARRRFVAALERLAKRDDSAARAALAALRSGLGKPPGSVVAMYQYVGDHLLGTGPHDRWPLWPSDQQYNDDLFTVASLFGLHPTGRPADDEAETTTKPGGDLDTSSTTEPAPSATATPRRRHGQPFLVALQPLRTGDTERDQALDRRVVALLNADRDALPTLLRQLVGLLGDERGPVDWLQLLKDLNQWDQPDRPVQKRWAGAWWAAPTRSEIARVSDSPSENAVVAGT